MIDLFAESGETAAKKKTGPRISAAFAFALAGHVLLFAALLIAHPPSSSSGSPERETIRRALAELAGEGGAAGGVSAADLDEAARIIGCSIRFRDEEDLRKKVEIVKAMIRSFFRAGGEKEGTYLDLSRLTLDEIQARIEDGTIRLPDGEKAFASKSAEDGHELEIHTLTRDDEREIDRLSRRNETVGGSDSARRAPPEVYYIDPEIYYRECPYEQILAHGPALFMVTEDFPDFAAAGGMKNEAKAGARVESASRRVDSSLLTVLLLSGEPGFSIESGAPASDPFDPKGKKELLDAWMAKPEREQFADFKREYLDRMDPDSEDLAGFADEFVATNLNGVFYTANLFAEAFDSLEELYYKRPIYDAYLGYARRHPGTRTAAAFLFNLAAAYDFERRTLRLLADVEPEADEILREGVRKPGVFDDRVKAYVLKKTMESIRAALVKNGILQVSEALDSYRNASRTIYRHLAGMDGEIRNRALFAAGMMLWEEGRINDALAAWRRVDPSYEAPAYRYIKSSLFSSGKELSRALEDLDKFMTAQARAGNQALLRRHLLYHKWATRAKAWAGMGGTGRPKR